ncbi:Sensor protein QseC [Pseudovibrio axinellae]|uniref:histidine kinase n=1 Tax=Pseudovibrio axinellae TaxID=989403 RepID=A0A165XNZ4_9HYPH|nr:sensor histidine kinase [Pseudovibrio axinellae]KZL17902.1 Sensor protein QseC [Pseudovibrio axinellae]SER58400.1 two-component system, OmpR family, sensor histidine kinase TctE [Pseudovibrio axinellae]
MTAISNVSGSIRRRLTLQLLGIAAVLAALLFIMVMTFAKQVAEESQDNILTASATSILDSAAIQGGGVTVDIPYSALSMLGNVSDDRVFYRVTANGKFLTGYKGLSVTKPGRKQERHSFMTSHYMGESIRMVSATRRLSYASGPVEVTVSVAQTLKRQTETLERISTSAFYLGFGFFIAAAILGVLSVQSAVKPIQILADSVSRRGPQDLRAVQAPVPGEMAPLVVALNRFMERLKKSLTRSEEFIAEAAHRVRTPLAVLRTQAEIALRRVERPENRASLKEMIRAIDESSRAAGQLLDHAMVSFRTDHLEVTKIDLLELGRETLERHQPLAEMQDKTLIIEGETPPPVSGDAILIQNALSNIIDNAIKYAPFGEDIKIRIGTEGHWVVVSVFDQGEGFNETDIKHLTTRFSRGGNAENTIGSGLGLTIAEEVVQAHGGYLKLSNRKNVTGACVSFYFPQS